MKNWNLLCPKTVNVVVYACHDLPLRTVDDVLLCLLVEFRLRCYAYILHPCLQFGFVKKAQFAVGFVVRDDASHHQLVKITHFDSEKFRGLGRRDQLVRLFHISVVFDVISKAVKAVIPIRKTVQSKLLEIT